MYINREQNCGTIFVSWWYFPCHLRPTEGEYTTKTIKMSNIDFWVFLIISQPTWKKNSFWQNGHYCIKWDLTLDCCGGVPNIEFILIFSKKKKTWSWKSVKEKNCWSANTEKESCAIYILTFYMVLKMDVFIVSQIK